MTALVGAERKTTRQPLEHRDNRYVHDQLKRWSESNE